MSNTESKNNKLQWIKTIFALLLGAFMIGKLFSILLPSSLIPLGAIGCVVSGWFWARYCFNYFFPLEK